MHQACVAGARKGKERGKAGAHAKGRGERPPDFKTKLRNAQPPLLPIGFICTNYVDDIKKKKKKIELSVQAN